MFYTTVIALVAAVAGASACWRLLGDRFPHPADLATISILYYSFPLALVASILEGDGGMVFLHQAASDPDIARRSMTSAAIAVVAIHVGRLIARNVHPGNILIKFQLTGDGATKVQIFLVLFLCQIVLGILLFGPDALFAGYNIESQSGTASTGQALLYSGIELTGLTVAYAYVILLATGKLPGVHLISFSLLFIVTLGLVRGKRLEIVSAFLPVVLLLFATKPAFRSRMRRVGIVIVTALLISLLASIRLGEPPNLASLAFNLFSEGLFAGHALPGLLDKLVNQGAEYEYGLRIIVGLLAFIPRFLWPGKDDVLYTSSTVFEGVAPLGATSMVGEVYLQGGNIAIAVFFLVAGYLMQKSTAFQSSFDTDLQRKRLSIGSIGYLVFMAIFIPHFRDGMIPSIKISLQAAVFLLVIASLHLRPRLAVELLFRHHDAKRG